jgi:hypothetical protein
MALASTEAELQVGEASVGSVELQTFPAPSTATHSDTEGHATPNTRVTPSAAGVLQVEPPSVELTALPLSSTATHD